MEHLGIERADVVGHSLGANTGLQMAIRHSEKARRLVAISPNFRTDGEYPEVWAGIAHMTPEVFAGSPIEESYQHNAPNPEDFPALVEKVKAFFGEEFAWPEADLRSIEAPVLVMVGDSDTVRPEHAVELFRLVGGGVPADVTGQLPASQLGILPGITHQSIVFERLDLPMAMIETFLAAPLPDAA
jgi:pimeloyl-ACP methyl ester carboxylesterase